MTKRKSKKGEQSFGSRIAWVDLQARLRSEETRRKLLQAYLDYECIPASRLFDLAQQYGVPQTEFESWHLEGCRQCLFFLEAYAAEARTTTVAMQGLSR